MKKKPTRRSKQKPYEPTAADWKWAAQLWRECIDEAFAKIPNLATLPPAKVDPK